MSLAQTIENDFHEFFEKLKAKLEADLGQHPAIAEHVDATKAEVTEAAQTHAAAAQSAVQTQPLAQLPSASAVGQTASEAQEAADPNRLKSGPVRPASAT